MDLIRWLIKQCKYKFKFPYEITLIGSLRNIKGMKPCACCGSKNVVVNEFVEAPDGIRSFFGKARKYLYYRYMPICLDCDNETEVDYNSFEQAVVAWNKLQKDIEAEELDDAEVSSNGVSEE